MSREFRARVPQSSSDKTVRRPIELSHQDWLLDRALEETFPASDPISPMCAQSFA